MTLSLPAFKGYPLASSNIILKTDKEQFDNKETKAKILPFKVNGIWLKNYEWLSFLISITDISVEDKIIFGADIHYWSEVTKFALELLAKQRYLLSYYMGQLFHTMGDRREYVNTY